jgi:hypothetical protein
VSGEPAFVDAEGALAAWVSTQTALVGAGNPLELGAHLNRLRGGSGAYVYLEQVGGTPDPSELPGTLARVSGHVYGRNRRHAAKAAAAYANALLTLDGHQVTQTTDREGKPLEVPAVLLAVGEISGPTYVPDGTEDRYLVDAVILLTPAP